MTVVYVPRDSAARSMGADEVAAAITAVCNRHGLDVTIVRNGSRGMLWLEPMIEVDGLPGVQDDGPRTARRQVATDMAMERLAGTGQTGVRPGHHHIGRRVAVTGSEFDLERFEQLTRLHVATPIW